MRNGKVEHKRRQMKSMTPGGSPVKFNSQLRIIMRPAFPKLSQKIRFFFQDLFSGRLFKKRSWIVTTVHTQKVKGGRI